MGRFLCGYGFPYTCVSVDSGQLSACERASIGWSGLLVRFLRYLDEPNRPVGDVDDLRENRRSLHEPARSWLSLKFSKERSRILEGEGAVLKCPSHRLIALEVIEAIARVKLRRNFDLI